MVRGAGITEWPVIRGRFLLRASFPARPSWHVWCGSTSLCFCVYSDAPCTAPPPDARPAPHAGVPRSCFPLLGPDGGGGGGGGAPLRAHPSSHAVSQETDSVEAATPPAPPAPSPPPASPPQASPTLSPARPQSPSSTRQASPAHSAASPAHSAADGYSEDDSPRKPSSSAGPSPGFVVRGACLRARCPLVAEALAFRDARLSLGNGGPLFGSLRTADGLQRDKIAITAVGGQPKGVGLLVSGRYVRAPGYGCGTKDGPGEGVPQGEGAPVPPRSLRLPASAHTSVCVGGGGGLTLPVISESHCCTPQITLTVRCGSASADSKRGARPLAGQGY